MIRTLLVDDEELVRAGFRMILESADDIEVVAEAEDGDQLVDAVARHRPEVVLLDVRMPRLDGLSALTELRRSGATPAVIMLTTFDLDEYVYGALRHGASGFLLKDTSPRDLVAAVRTVADGSAMLSPSVTRKLLDAFVRQAHPDSVAAQQMLDRLTDREREVVAAVARGKSNAEIARELFASETTVKAHVSRSLTKLDLSNRVQLAMIVRDAQG